MPYQVHDPRLFYDAVVSQLTTSTGRSIGEAQARNYSAPYAVVYPLDEDDVESSIDNLTDITLFRFQVTSVGDSMDSALVMQKSCRTALLGFIPTVAGVTCMPIAREGGFNVQRDDDIQPPKFFVGDIFTCFVD